MERSMLQNQSNAGNTQYPQLPQRKNAEVESTRREDVGWMAGIIDGEGTIGMSIQSLYNGFTIKKKDKEYGDYQYPNVCAWISMTSTSFDLLRRYTEILTAWGIRYHYCLNANSKKKNAWNDSVIVRISRINSVHKLLSIIRPYLTEKKPRADLILEFCEWRIGLRLKWKTQHPQKRNSIGQIQKGRALGEVEQAKQKEFWERFKALPAKKPDVRLSETSRLGSRPIEIKG